MTKVSKARDAKIFIIASGQSVICYEEDGKWIEPHTINIKNERNEKGQFVPVYYFDPILKFNPDINWMKAIKDEKLITHYSAGRQARDVFAEYLDARRAQKAGIILTNQGVPGQMN